MSIGTGAALVIAAATATAGTAYAAHKAGEAADKQAAASDKATDAETRAADEALAFDKQVLAKRTSDLQPFVAAGRGASDTQADLLGISRSVSRAPATEIKEPFKVQAPATGTVATGMMPKVSPADLGPDVGVPPSQAMTNFDAQPQQAAQGMVTVIAPDGSTKQMNQASAELYRKLYGLTVIPAGGA